MNIKIPGRNRIIQVYKRWQDKPDFFERLKRKQFAQSFKPPVLNPPTPQEQLSIDSLRKAISELPILGKSNSPAESKWISFKNELRNDILAKDPRTMLSWPVVINNMFYSASIKDFNEVKASDMWPLFKEAIIEPTHLNFKPYFAYSQASENTIRQMYHLYTFMKTTGENIKDQQIIIDFGGGYGSMCRLVHNMGFQGHYIIFDWPEFSLLQKFYLSQSLPSLEKIHFVQSVEDLQKTLSTLQGNKLLIATWSLSESPVELRDKIVGTTKPDAILIAYQEKFGGIYNPDYFSQLQTKFPHLEWYTHTMRYIPSERNKYLFAKHK